MNLIVVTAGNYKVKATDDFGGGAVEPSAALRSTDPQLMNRGDRKDRREKNWIFSAFSARSAVNHVTSLMSPTLHAHPEDDPMEKHDHPTARQRLGDSEAGPRLGGHADVGGRSEAVRGILDAADFFAGRLPEAFGGYPREQTKYPVQYPTACSPQAWSTGTPMLLMRAMLGLEPEGEHLVIDPALPSYIGRLELLDIPGRWGRIDAFGRGRVDVDPQDKPRSRAKRRPKKNLGARN